MISVSYLKSKFNKEETLNKIDNSICDYIHVDLMDGIYAGVNNFTIEQVINDLKYLNKPLDVHLMTINPEIYINDLAKLNTDIITFHLDATDKPLKVINLIKKYSIKVGIAINPEDDLDILSGYLNKIDYVLIMSVHPGKGGQKFMKSCIKKIKKLQNTNLLIGVDGGLNDESIKYLKDLKVDNKISGSFICMSDDYNKQIKKINK